MYVWILAVLYSPDRLGFNEAKKIMSMGQINHDMQKGYQQIQKLSEYDADSSDEDEDQGENGFKNEMSEAVQI